MLLITFSFFSCCIVFFSSCCILTIPSKCSIVSCCILTTLPVVILPFAPQLLYFHLLPQSCRTAPFANLQRAVALALGPISKIVSLKMKTKTRMRKHVRRVDRQVIMVLCYSPTPCPSSFAVLASRWCSRITMVWRSRPTLSLLYCRNITCSGLPFNLCCVSDEPSIADPMLTSSREHNCCSVCHMTLKHTSSSWFEWLIIYQPTVDQFSCHLAEKNTQSSPPYRKNLVLLPTIIFWFPDCCCYNWWWWWSIANQEPTNNVAEVGDYHSVGDLWS